MLKIGVACALGAKRPADCFAGIWAHHADDDRLQRQSRGYVTPDSFTHGSSAQRMRWFRQGLETGRVSQCNTFKADNL
jgi:predicted metalloprotease